MGGAARSPIRMNCLDFRNGFFTDFITHTGRRILDIFMEEIGPSLNSEQRAMLEDWTIWNRARLLEFQEIKPGIGVVVQDLLSDEIFEVNDISASYNVSRWMLACFARSALPGGYHLQEQQQSFRPRKKMASWKLPRRSGPSTRPNTPAAACLISIAITV